MKNKKNLILHLISLGILCAGYVLTRYVFFDLHGMKAWPLVLFVCGIVVIGISFIAKAKQYIEMPTLTPELLRVFIRKIEVFEKLEKYSRTAGNLINIHYAFQLPEQDGMPMLEMLLASNMRETA